MRASFSSFRVSYMQLCIINCNYWVNIKYVERLSNVKSKIYYLLLFSSVPVMSCQQFLTSSLQQISIMLIYVVHWLPFNNVLGWSLHVFTKNFYIKTNALITVCITSAKYWYGYQRLIGKGSTNQNRVETSTQTQQ